MDFLRDTKIDFMGRRRLWMTVSLILNVIAILVVFVQGRLNLGVDFAGGTQLTVRFAQTPDVNQLRELVRGAGVAEASIQRLGTGQENEVIGKMRVVDLLQSMPGLGKVRARQMMERLSISESRRVRGLGANQIAALEREFGSRG